MRFRTLFQLTQSSQAAATGSCSIVRRTFIRPTRVEMAPTPIPLPRHLCDALGLGQHEVAFREGSATIVMPSKSAAFLNPVQEFNRDLSVLALRAWSEQRNEEKREVFEKATAKRLAAKANKRPAKGSGVGKQGKRQKIQPEDGGAVAEASREQTEPTDDNAEASTSTAPPPQSEQYRDYRFSVLEALSATGLRSIRYAREIPLLKRVLANDLSTSAVAAMKRNVALNFPAGKAVEVWQPLPRENVAPGADKRTKAAAAAQVQSAEMEDTIAAIENGIAANAKQTVSIVSNDSDKSDSASASASKPVNGMPAGHAIHPDCKVQINEGDAMTLMYSHREDRRKFDVVDLDPYGSASMFLDGAVQCIADGGLLCVTCTDTAVLAGTSHPEKCYSAYGGVTTKVEYSHEFALRLLLHAIATSAGRYGRHIQPMLSLSIDFYIRVFVRVSRSPVEVKKLASKTGIVLTCTNCQAYSTVPLGRYHAQNETRDGQVLEKFQPGIGPSVGDSCVNCSQRFHVAGPMWLGKLHDVDFLKRMLAIVHTEPDRFGTAARIQGMVGVAMEELPGDEVPFYFTPSRLSALFRCQAPSLQTVVSALLHAGHRVSRSHCKPGSVKTSATRQQVYDLWLAWVKRNPVKMESISPTSPTHRLLHRTPSQDTQWNLDDDHTETKGILEGSDSSLGTRYQVNPLPHWGPGTAARTTRASVTTK